VPFVIPEILRRLDKGDAGIVETRDQVFQEIRFDLVVRIDDADDLGIRRGLGEGEIQGAGLVAGPLIQVDVFEIPP
jgi:hypothetical protein